MKKEKVIYRLNRYVGEVIYAKREISYEIKITSRLLLDEICFIWNKNKLLDEINSALDQRDKENFIQLSMAYRHYVWE